MDLRSHEQFPGLSVAFPPSLGLQSTVYGLPSMVHGLRSTFDRLSPQFQDEGDSQGVEVELAGVDQVPDLLDEVLVCGDVQTGQVWG